MKNPHNPARHHRLALIATAIAMALTTPVYAAEGEADKDAEVVEITGSRLKGVDMEGASPVTTISRDDLNVSSSDSIADFLKDLPQTSSAGTFSTAGGLASGTRGQPAGSAGVALRGLGSSATLVLVNGRRVAVDSFTNGFDSFVDINSIPMTAVERIEILTDGASSVYGSDAVAGVINFILRRDFDGHEISLMHSNDLKDSSFTKNNFTYVGGFNNEKSNTTIIVDYFDRDALFNKDRDVDVTFFSSTRVNIDGGTFAEPWCGSDTTNGGTRCRYDYVGQRAIESDTENLGVTLSHHSDLGFAEFFAEVMYQKNEGFAYDAPASFDVFVAGDSAVVPQWARDENGGDADDIRVRSRFPDRRTQAFEDKSVRLLAGLRGDVGQWSWETAVMSAKAESTIRHVAGFYSIDAVDAAIAAGDFNPFNLGRDNSAAQLAAVQDAAPRVGESTVKAIDFKLTGDLFDLPAGSVAAAFGAEYRSEDMFDEPADIAVQDGIYGLGATNAEADRSQYAVFGEVNLPITSIFDVTASLRMDHYSDFGSSTNPRIAARLRASDDLIFRASWSTAFRAPSLSQLGSGTTLGTNFINCEAGDPFYALCGSFGQADGELEFEQETLGNTELDAEKSTAVNVGLSWNLTADLQVTVDYWKYTHEDIVDVDANTTLRACINGDAPIVNDPNDLTGNTFGCYVDGGGDLAFLRTGFFNVGEQETDGIDFKLDYKMGDYKLYFDASRTFSYERQIAPDLPKEDLLGRLSGENEIGRPELVADLGLKYSGPLFWSVSANYTDELGDGDFQFDDHPTVDSWLIWNASVGYDITDKSTVLLKVRNLSDKEPPFASSPTAGYASSVHDWYGRLITVRYTYSF